MSKSKLFQVGIWTVFLIVSVFLFAHKVMACDADGWYNVGSSYSCCEGTESCQCQDQEYRTYSTVCTAWSQACTSWSTVCAEQGQCCAGYGTRCAVWGWGPQVCLSYAQVCSAYTQTQVCTGYTQYCSNISFVCTAYTTYCAVTYSNCGCTGATFLGYCIGSWVCNPYCVAYGTSCTQYTSVCTGWSIYCSSYSTVTVCSAYTQVCTNLYLPSVCTHYETYCTGYQSCCLRTAQVCASWQPYCAAYGCSYSVTNHRTVQSNCSLVNGQCGYVAVPPPGSPQATWTYCIDSLHPTLNWTYSDGTQSSYWIQIDNTNASFPSPEVDTGEIISSNHSYATTYSFNWNTKYWWRVKVKNQQGIWSDWSNTVSFTTPKHAYPKPDFSYSPSEPYMNEITQFTDQSVAYGSGSPIKAWAWTFQDGSPSNSTVQNSQSEFISGGSKTITLGVKDSDNYECGISSSAYTASKIVNVAFKVNWKEILPR